MMTSPVGQQLGVLVEDLGRQPAAGGRHDVAGPPQLDEVVAALRPATVHRQAEPGCDPQRDGDEDADGLEREIVDAHRQQPAEAHAPGPGHEVDADGEGHRDRQGEDQDDEPGHHGAGHHDPTREALERSDPALYAAAHQNCLRTAQRSGKAWVKMDRRRNSTPSEPPVPALSPMVRSTSLAWR